jgi:hypothetical protein
MIVSSSGYCLAEHCLFACPFCPAPSLTLSEQVQSVDTAVLVQWVKGEPTDLEAGFPGSTEYEIVDIMHDSTGTLEKGAALQVRRYRAAQPGDLFLLMGVQTTTLEWMPPMEVTETGYQYILQAPSREAGTTERLKYFARFLEYPDPLIAQDAWSEFANAPYEDIVPVAGELDPEKVREWVLSDETNPMRLGLYGLLLGLCGDPEDAPAIREKILAKADTLRLGIDGVMAGYLLLTGVEGLEVIEQEKLVNPEAPFSETYAALQALRFMLNYVPDRIPRDRLAESLRQMLDRPELADLIISDLARWGDWTVVDRLYSMYDSEGFSEPAIKRAIIRYFLLAQHSGNKAVSEGETMPEYAEKATQYLDTITAQDPQTVENAKRYFMAPETT